MKIVDTAGRRIEACCQFEHRGYTISISTVFHSHWAEVAVFTTTNPHTFKTFANVEAAMDYINQITEEQTA
jgi:hypothetical protein